ncbi:replication protein [Streptococcus suis]|nr:replication protein [Streptococcus suis]
MTKFKEKRSNKWAFLLYRDSVPENYLDILEEMHVPFVLSPWHDKDVNKKTGEFKKAHKHGALFFESLKSYSQVSELLSEKLNTPSHIEVVMSPKGMYDYFTHAENPDKTLYNIEDIECGCGFELDKFLIEHDSGLFLEAVIDVITENDFTEFEDLVQYARFNDNSLLGLIIERTYFFTKFLDSRRHNPQNKLKTSSEGTLASNSDEVNTEDGIS